MVQPTTKSSKLDAESLPRLVSITALWRNNTDEGFGFHLAGVGVQDVANAIADLYQSLKRTPREEFESFLSDLVPSQLVEAGKAHKLRLQGNRTKELEQIVIIGGAANVYILEQEKRLQADKYNGMVFVFSAPVDGVFVDP
jgi:hypothetical protein